MSLVSELKRHNVFKVGVAYGTVAWLEWRIASVFFPTFGAPQLNFALTGQLRYAT